MTVADRALSSGASWVAVGAALAALSLRSPGWDAVGVLVACAFVGVMVPVDPRTRTGRVRATPGAEALRAARAEVVHAGPDAASPRRRSPATRVAVLAVVMLGLVPFAVVRLAWPEPTVPATLVGVAAAAFAGVAEEAVFRRALYGRLERFGPPVAVVTAAAAFAVVHVPIHGTGSVGVNLAAGLVFGWQRCASGSWTAPAATHAFANLVQLG